MPEELCFPALPPFYPGKETNMFFWIFFLAIFIFIAAPSSPAEKDAPFSLQIRSADGRRILVAIPIHPGDQFYFHFSHSSEKTPIRDTFRVSEEGQLTLIEEAFLWCAAGLEFRTHKEIQFVNEGKWCKVRLNRSLPELLIRVGRVAEQVVVIRDRSIRLDKLVKPGEGVILSITQ